MREGQQRGLSGGGGVCPSLHLARSPFCHPGPNPPSSSHSLSACYPARLGPDPRSGTQTPTHLEDTEWRQKGARAACPARTPLTTPGNGEKKKEEEETLVFFSNFASSRAPQKQPRCCASSLTLSHTHTSFRVKQKRYSSNPAVTPGLLSENLSNNFVITATARKHSDALLTM